MKERRSACASKWLQMPGESVEQWQKQPVSMKNTPQKQAGMPFKYYEELCSGKKPRILLTLCKCQE